MPLLDELNTEQRKVVEEADGPCLVIAGAGSGKTRTIAYRVAYLLEQGTPPSRILLVTFTNKAAKEMIARVERLSGEQAYGIWAGTFHSLCHRLLREGIVPSPRGLSFSILDQDDARALLKRCLKERGLDREATRFPAPALCLEILSFARNTDQSPEAVIEERFPHLIRFLSPLQDIFQAYERKKQESRVMDFDDLLLFVRDALRDDLLLREAVASRFTHVLVDEYQDTNRVQADVVDFWSSAFHNVLAVGDDAQSIYSFRGADVTNMLAFSERYPQARLFHLLQNYRSTPQILDCANHVLDKNQAQYRKALQPTRESAEKPKIVSGRSPAEEAKRICDELERQVDSGVPPDQIAVLFRAAFHSQALELELTRRGIPYEYRGGLTFFQRAHIRDILAFLRILFSAKDEAAWLRILSLCPGMGPVTVDRFLPYLLSFSELTELLAHPIPAGLLSARAAKSWQELEQTFRAMLAVKEEPSQAIERAVKGFYESYVTLEYPDADDRLEDIASFAAFAERTPSLERFLSEITLGQQEEQGSDTLPKKRLVLSTIHQAKGLEWDIVFVLRLSDGSFPHPRAFAEKGGIEEERRLLYVASTRARERLYFCYAAFSGMGEGGGTGLPSPFLRDLPEDVFHRSSRLPRSSAFSTEDEPFSDSFEPVIVWDDTPSPSASSRKRPVSFLRPV